MAVTISGTDGIVGAGFTVDASGISVTAGVVTATSIDANASGLTGDLPAGINIPAAQLVGICTAGLTKTGGFGKFSSYAVIADVKGGNANGGTFTLGAWRTRDLNTELADADSIVSISSNQFTLAAGSYLIMASATALRVSSHQLRLYNISSSAAVQSGNVEYAAGGSGKSGNTARASARVVISGSTVFEIQHRGAATQADYGFGAGSSGALDWAGDTATTGAIYCIVEIFKEA